MDEAPDDNGNQGTGRLISDSRGRRFIESRGYHSQAEWARDFAGKIAP